MTHIRIDQEASDVIETLTKRGGLYPQFAGRSGTHVVNELLRESQTYRDCLKQIGSEQHPRPGAKKK